MAEAQRLTLEQLILSRIGQDFDGECYLTEEEALRVLATLKAQREALEPFAKALGNVAGPDKVRWPDHETIEYSGAAEEITWGDLRRARASIEGNPTA